jgi:hypothetical protein
MLDHDDRTLTKKLTPLTQEELATYNTLVDSPDKVHPSVFFPPSPESPTSVVSANVISIQHSADDVVRSQPSAGGCTSPTAPSLPPFPTLEDATTTSAAVGTPSAGGPSPPAPSAGGVPIAARQEGHEGSPSLPPPPTLAGSTFSAVDTPPAGGLHRLHPWPAGTPQPPCRSYARGAQLRLWLPRLYFCRGQWQRLSPRH